MRTVELAERTGTSYRQIDYWIRAGVPIGVVQAKGSGTRRAFDETDVKIVNIMAQLSHLIGGGGRKEGSVVMVDIMKGVALDIRERPSLAKRRVLHIGTDGRVHYKPVTGWTIVKEEIRNAHDVLSDA